MLINPKKSHGHHIWCRRARAVLPWACLPGRRLGPLHMHIGFLEYLAKNQKWSGRQKYSARPITLAHNEILTNNFCICDKLIIGSEYSLIHISYFLRLCGQHMPRRSYVHTYASKSILQTEHALGSWMPYNTKGSVSTNYWIYIMQLDSICKQSCVHTQLHRARGAYLVFWNG